MTPLHPCRRGRGASLLAALIVVGACAPVLSAPAHPAWVTALIRDIGSEPVRSPPAHVARYEFRGAEVYFVPAYCCDFFSVLYDEAGAVLCHPDGGLTGRGDGRCPEFMTERRRERIVWRDRRS
jgi:hypothetical protein